MVAMTVRDEDMLDAHSLGSLGDGLEMLRVLGARIDNCEFVAADEIGVGAEEGVRGGIIGDDTAYALRHLFGDAVMHVNAAIESKLRRHLVLGV